MKYGVSSLSLTETLDSFLPFNFVASCFNIFYYFIWALLGGSSDTFISFLLKNQVVIKKQQNKTAMCTQNCINLLDIYCLPTGFWVFSVIAENPSAIGKKKKAQTHLSVRWFFWFQESLMSYATTFQVWLGFCPGMYCTHASTSVPRNARRHLWWHRGSSLPAPAPLSTAELGGCQGSRLTFRCQSGHRCGCWTPQQSNQVVDKTGRQHWTVQPGGNDLLCQLCGIYFLSPF